MRHRNGLAPYHIAEKMGIATQVIKAWEAGKESPDPRQMRTLVALLGR